MKGEPYAVSIGRNKEVAVAEAKKTIDETIFQLEQKPKRKTARHI